MPFLRTAVLRRTGALFLALILCLSPLSSLARTYDIGNGDIIVTAEKEGEENVQKVNGQLDDTRIVITGSITGSINGNRHSVVLEAGEGATVEITIQNLSLDNSAIGEGAIVTAGSGSVTIELDGENSLAAGQSHAGLQKGNDGALTIQDDTGDGGSLTATGGAYAAGIGGGDSGDGTDITISGGTVVATGGELAAGIGGAGGGGGTDITISGGTVVATGGAGGAGIGGGILGNGGAITISGGTVVATGGASGAGIGGGKDGDGTDITISGDAQLAVAGGDAQEENPGYYYAGAGAAIGTGGKGLADVPGEETKPNTDNLTTGHIDYYAAGTTAEQIQSGAAIPTGTICGSTHAPGTPQKENETAGTCTVDGGYDMVTRCTLCGEALSSEHINTGKTDHTWTPATCTAPKTCSVCRATEGAALGHTWTPATCIAPKTCSVCRATEGAALGHTWTPATCTAPKTCSVCQATEGAALGHDWVIDMAVAETCSNTGLTEGKHCARCAEKVEQQVLPAKGHSPGAPQKENEVAPQIGVAGSYDSVVYCTVCQAELSRITETVPALEPEPEPEPTPVHVDDPFTAFCKALAYRIRTAPENGTVEADATPWPGLQRIVFEALNARQDVTLALTCRIGGQPAELTVPAGADLLGRMDGLDMLTFEEIAGYLN